ncbi:hypothetical protein AAH450_09120 [Erwinia sp. P7711]|uniref:hypothetical protein n=1 Tax=Erwinia sp. P7711 TaxID=3141451 RepID=UPI00319C86FB
MSARKGITLSLLSSVLFSVLCYYSAFLYPLNGWQIAGWRAVTTALLLVLVFRRKLRPFWHYLLSVVKSMRLLAAACVCAMLPGLHLVALIVMLGYPPYFIIKRQLKNDALFSVIAENLLLVVPAIAVLVYQGSGNEWLPAGPAGGWGTLTGLGLLSSSALLCFLLASSILSFTLFGMLSYVEPLLLFLVSLFLPGEKLTLASLLTYAPIWLAVLALMAEGYKKVKSTAHRSG